MVIKGIKNSTLFWSITIFVIWAKYTYKIWDFCGTPSSFFRAMINNSDSICLDKMPWPGVLNVVGLLFAEMVNVIAAVLLILAIMVQMVVWVNQLMNNKPVSWFWK